MTALRFLFGRWRKPDDLTHWSSWPPGESSTREQHAAGAVTGGVSFSALPVWSTINCRQIFGGRQGRGAGRRLRGTALRPQTWAWALASSAQDGVMRLLQEVPVNADTTR